MSKQRYTFTNSPPRFQVKPAASMREGEPIVWALTLDRGEGGNDRTAAEVIRDKQRALEANYGQEWKADIPEHAASHARFIIDTHSPDWQAFDAKHRKGENSDQADAITYAHEALRKAYTEAGPPHRWRHEADYYRCSCGVMSRNQPRGLPSTACEIAWRLYAESNMLESDVLPEIAKPQGPTDAAIVKAWEDAMRGLEAIGDWNEIAKVKRVGLWGCSSESGGSATWGEYQAARSRELQKRAAESREKDRQRVVCEGTLECDY